jgi:Arc/MetJ-type ribon-helix-helix transcriptional regulator
MGPVDSKSYQLRVRVTAEERDLLEKLRIERGRGETISDLVREAISLLADPSAKGAAKVRNAKTRRQVERLAILLKREPQQVEEACVEGILDLIELKCEVPLIVMETRLHLKYRNRDEKEHFPWNDEKKPEQNPAEAAAENPAPTPDTPPSS